ncbi:hypothetical protein [Azospirillum sp. B510]|uniref:hypothetical protein n=1 Tax=Azospirillum sp. (strain B510) TaxID=137722 RepID=UPI000302A52D|nr:hypothetical protein [Azospirillum sp. B510]
MPATAEPLPTDIETLRAIIAAQAAELAAERRCREASEAELAAAKAGLVAKALEVENAYFGGKHPAGTAESARAER